MIILDYLVCSRLCSLSEIGLLHQSTKQKKYKHNLIETKYNANGFGRSEACLSPNPFGQCWLIFYPTVTVKFSTYFWNKRKYYGICKFYIGYRLRFIFQNINMCKNKIPICCILVQFFLRHGELFIPYYTQWNTEYKVFKSLHWNYSNYTWIKIDNLLLFFCPNVSWPDLG